MRFDFSFNKVVKQASAIFDININIASILPEGNLRLPRQAHHQILRRERRHVYHITSTHQQQQHHH